VFESIPAISSSRKFDEPIVVGKGKALRTLRDAGNYVAALPKKVAALSHWQVAASCLLAAVEKGGPCRDGEDCHATRVAGGRTRACSDAAEEACQEISACPMKD